MGRQLHRVPLDFDWPVNTIWKGYINPHYKGHCRDCDECNGVGTTTARQRLEDLVSLLMISAEDALREKAHPYFLHAPLYRTQGIFVSKDMAALTGGLAGRECRGGIFGHDSIDNWQAAKAIIKAAGLSEDWGLCPNCKGECSLWDSPENKEKAEKWERGGPPEGEGYQLWETVSEGSPCSPVFKTPEELAHWLTHSPDYRGRIVDGGTTYDQWMRFILGPGWAPSAVIGPKGFQTGVQACETNI